jgi:adenosylcobinamide kinase/adenosylcobinamide-phosphate guanylyltransferase
LEEKVAKEFILILGGARSGKSSYAQQMALNLGGPDVLFVATAEAYDDEMRVRIAAHQADRPAGWRTVEAPRRVAEQIAPATAGALVVLVDCLTLLASNALLSAAVDATHQQAEAAVLAEVDGLLAACRASDATWIMVSNEVGLGLVPPYPLGRLYRDALGRANQRIAAAADRVIFMVAGLPMRVK